jgi:hypothetical protein
MDAIQKSLAFANRCIGWHPFRRYRRRSAPLIETRLWLARTYTPKCDFEWIWAVVQAGTRPSINSDANDTARDSVSDHARCASRPHTSRQLYGPWLKARL